MKATEIIRAALTRLGVYATGEEVPADDAIPALRVLNDLLEQYRLQPLMRLPITLVLPLKPHDEVLLTSNLNRVVITGLAIELGTDYGIEPSGSVMRSHQSALAALKLSNGVMLIKESDLSHGKGGDFYASS